MSDTFGITVLTSVCAFSAEILRSAIKPNLALIDEDFDEREVPQSDEERVELAIYDALDLASAMTDGEIDREAAVTDIAINFIYAYLRQAKITDYSGMRGMLACVKDEAFVVHPCTSEESYTEGSEAFREVSKIYMGGEDEDDAPPTIH